MLFKRITQKDAVVAHERLMELLTEDDAEFNDNWIDEISFKVGRCLANIAGYLEERRPNIIHLLGGIA